MTTPLSTLTVAHGRAEISSVIFIILFKRCKYLLQSFPVLGLILNLSEEQLSSVRHTQRVRMDLDFMILNKLNP